MPFKFEKLTVWNLTLDLTIGIEEVAKALPVDERYNLSNQIRKAADSVVLNIAEGSTGQSNPEFRRFLSYALRSGIEVVSCLFIAKRKQYISEEVFHQFYGQYEGLCKMISKLRGSLAGR